MNKRGGFFGLFGRGKVYSNPYAELVKIKAGNVMTADVVTVPKGDSLDDAAHTMIGSHVSCVVVVDNNRPVGILSERDFIKRLDMGKHNLSKDMVADDVMRKNIFTVTPDINLFEAQQTMFTNKARKLIVVDKRGLLTGILTQTDLCKTVNELRTAIISPPFVKDVMTKKVLTAGEDNRFVKIKRLLAQHDVGSIIIMDKKVIKGIFTEFDLVSEFFLNPNRLRNSFMKDLMTAPVLCVSPDFNLVQINKLMLDHRFRRLLVVKDDNMMGIVTQTDVTRKLYNFIKEKKDVVDKKIRAMSKQEYEIKKKENIIFYNVKSSKK